MPHLIDRIRRGSREERQRSEGELLLLSPREISPNPNQPRVHFDEEELEALAESIREYGLIQPLAVSRGKEGYSLIAGERRLRACRLLGLARVPCVLLREEGERGAAMALVENMQRADLDPFEEAEAISALMAWHGETQEEVARRLSLSQSAVANKLRLLRLEESVRRGILDGGLSERHARALLRLEGEEARLRALSRIVKESMTVEKTEAMIAALSGDKPRRPSSRGAVKEIGFFQNTVGRAVKLARRSGLVLCEEREETESEWIFIYRVKKGGGGGNL